jgi:hypothetical protein
MRAEEWRLVVGYAQVLVFLLSCCFFITITDPEAEETHDFQPNPREMGRSGSVYDVRGKSDTRLDVTKGMRFGG